MRREDVLYHVLCGAPPAAEAGAFVELAKRAGWDVCVVATPLGTRFADLERLAELAGRPVRHDFKLPGEPDPFPPATPSQYRHSLARLRKWGVRVLGAEESSPSSGWMQPWQRVLEALPPHPRSATRAV